MATDIDWTAECAALERRIGARISLDRETLAPQATTAAGLWRSGRASGRRRRRSDVVLDLALLCALPGVAFEIDDARRCLNELPPGRLVRRERRRASVSEVISARR